MKQKIALALTAIISLFVLFTLNASAQQSPCQGFQGCTGIGSATSGAVGYVPTVVSTTPFLTYTLKPVATSSGSASVTSTYVGYGNPSNTLTGSSSFNFNALTGLVQAQLINGIAYAGDFPGVDANAQVNNAYAALPASGGTIYYGCGVFNVTTPVVFNTAGKAVILTGCGGSGFYNNAGTTLIWGNSTGTVITYNTNDWSSAGLGIKNLSIFGPGGNSVAASSTSPTATAANTTVGIYGGGSNGATSLQIDGVNIGGMGIAYIAGENQFLLNITNSSFLKDGLALQNLVTTGAVGENMRVTNSVFADAQSNGSSISDYCVYLQQSGNIQWTFTNNSFDDCQIYSTQYGGTANIIRLIGNHFEDPNTGQNPYYFVAGNATQNTVGGMVWQSIGNDYMQDQSNGQSAVLNGSNFLSTGDTVEVNTPVNTPMTNFIVNQDANDIASWSNLQQLYANSSASAAITYVAGTTPYSQNGLVYGTSTAAFTSGTSTYSIGATLSLPNIAVNSFLATNASHQVIATGTPSGGGGGVATTSPYTAGYVPVASTSLALTNSNIYQVNTSSYATIAFDASSTWTTDTSVTQATTSITVGSGVDEMLLALVLSTNSSTATATYNGTAMTQILAKTATGSDTRTLTLFALQNPASGTHLVTIGAGTSQAVLQVGAMSYSGVNQSLTFDATTTNEVTSTANTYTVSLTTISNNDWLVAGMREELSVGSPVAGTSTRFVVKSGSNTTFFADSNGAKTPAGSYSLGLTDSGGTGGVYSVVIAMAPALLSSSTYLGIGTTNPLYNLDLGNNGIIHANTLDLITPTGTTPLITLTGTNPTLNLTNLNDSATKAGGFSVEYNGFQLGYGGQNNNLYIGQAFNSGNNYIGTTGNNGVAVTTPANLSTVLDDGLGHTWFTTTVSVGTSTTSTAALYINGAIQATGSSTIVTPSIGGAIVTSGCDSATSSVAGYGLSSTTTGFFTTPEIQPGAVSFYTVLTTSSTITTYVCADITITPTSTPYVVKIIK